MNRSIKSPAICQLILIGSCRQVVSLICISMPTDTDCHFSSFCYRLDTTERSAGLQAANSMRHSRPLHKPLTYEMFFTCSKIQLQIDQRH